MPVLFFLKLASVNITDLLSVAGSANVSEEAIASIYRTKVPEDGGRNFLRIICKSVLDYVTSCPRSVVIIFSFSFARKHYKF